VELPSANWINKIPKIEFLPLDWIYRSNYGNCGVTYIGQDRPFAISLWSQFSNWSL